VGLKGSKNKPLVLEGKAAVVTGAGAGIGRAIAIEFAREGASILAADVDIEAALETANLVEAAGGRARSMQADVSAPDQVEAMVDMALSEMNGLDILVNNAGVSHPAQSILDLDLDHLDRVFAVDFKGVYLCSRAGGKAMLAKGGGVILNISSIAGLTPLPLPVYGPMKSAVNMLTRILARDWAECGIRVNAIAPGYVLTPLIQGLIDKGLRNPGLIIERTPMKTMLSPGDIAAAALFLASDASRHITGAVLPADAGWISDGGWSAYPTVVRRKKETK
jgi:NAD(P)-dependent dehydrogenase (short-subunit alcohol dehydrogenase family)